MRPSLVFVAGPLKGRSVPLTDDDTSIGRESSNHLAIMDLALSRRHCVIHRCDDGFTVTDLESRNGTFVNGVPVHERELHDGDEITLGSSLLLFMSASETAAPPVSDRPTVPVESQTPTDNTQTTVFPAVVLQRADARYLPPSFGASVQPASSGATSPPSLSLGATGAPALGSESARRSPWADSQVATARAAQDLAALLRISTAIHTIREADALYQTLTDLLFDAVPAEYGVVLIAGEREGELVPTYSRQSDSTDPMAVSQTIAGRVVDEGIAVLADDFSEGEFAHAHSAIRTGVRSVLCAPLGSSEKHVGAIYLATRDWTALFDESHLQLVTAAAAIAGLALENIGHIERLEIETHRLRNEFAIEHSMVGESPKMQEIYRFISKVAPTDATVLIRGESGTGKELVARAIHANSPRAKRPFVSINCAALTESLLESELFGHEKGAFTGAVAQKQGKLEVAASGTLFLDEIGELAPQLQAKLLRVLQHYEFERVGGTRSIKVDIRVITATNRDLEHAMTSGSFREDLYYRLNVISVTMPALRERREDIPLLGNYFVKQYGAKCKRHITGVSAEARACLKNYDWPGNVRELENAIERAAVLGTTDRILLEDLPEALHERDFAVTSSGSGTNYHDAVNEAKKALIIRAVDEAGGNYAQAARLLGLQPTYLHRLIRNFELKDRFKS